MPKDPISANEREEWEKKEADRLEKEKEEKKIEAEADSVFSRDLQKSIQENAETDKEKELGPKRWNFWGKNK